MEGFVWLYCAAGLAVAVAAAGAINLTGQVPVGTFNTYLYRGTPGFQERKNLLITLLQADRGESKVPDILCLQEVFRRSDIRDIVDAVKNSNYPYHASFEDLEEQPSLLPACTGEGAQDYHRCLQQCSVKPGTALSNCSLVECGVFGRQLSRPCRSCLVLEANSQADLEVDTFTRCTSTIPASEYAVPYGVLLLSRYPLSQTVARDYLDTPHIHSAVPRGYIAAEIEGYTFLCTHLQANYHEYLFAGPPQFSSYEEQHANEVRVIHRTVEGTNDAILLGDFNHGPPLPGCVADFPQNYRLLTSGGFFSATVQHLGLCTFCADNLWLKDEVRTDLVLDHIYLHPSKQTSVVRVDRMFDSLYTSGPSELHLSDHYGVRAVLDFTEMNRHRFCPSNSVEYARYLQTPESDLFICHVHEH